MSPLRGLAVAIAVLVLATSVPGAAQLPQLTETIEVRVVNVDVVVTTDDGTPIAGLGPEDFELRVNGKPVEIDYFSAIRDGALLRRGTDPRPPAEIEDLGRDEGLEYKPYLAVLFDGRSLDTVGAPDLFAELGLNLERLAASTRGVMFVRHGRDLKLGRSFSRRPEVLEREMARLSENRVRALDDTGRDILLRRLERAQVAAFTTSSEDPAADMAAELDAISFLSEIRGLSQIEMAQTSNALRDLSEFVRSLAGLPGRKSVLYLGPGFNVRPGEVMFKLWWAKYAAIAHEVGVDSIDAEITKYRIEDAMVRLISEASENGVTFYAYDPAGLQPLGSDATLGTMLAVDLSASELDWSREALLSLATGTGGVGQAEANRLQHLINRMVGDFRTYYSLGFEPAEDAPDRGRIRVRMRHPGYRVRHVDHFAVHNPKRRLEERTMAALFTDEVRNPLEFGVEVEAGVKQKDGTVVMPLLLKVPISRITLLPQETSHVGRLEVVMIVQGERGDLSEPAHGEMPIEIANRDLLAAMNRLAGYRVRLRMRRGEQRIAIGVRDQITGEDSTLNLVVDAGGAGR